MRNALVIAGLSVGLVFGMGSLAGSQIPVNPQGEIIVYSLAEGKVQIQPNGERIVSRPGDVIDLEVKDFSPYKAKQQSTDWCWAACLQMLINHRDIMLSQSDIVSQLKGRIVYDTASPDEIQKYLSNAYKLKDGTSWKANTRYFPKMINPDVMFRMLGVTKRPLLVSVRLEDDEDTQHLVVVFKTSFRAGGPVQSITIYDPNDGSESTLSWKEAEERVTAFFIAEVIGSEQKDPRIFTNPNYKPR